ncbi:MAG: spermidine/putrescine ABC transporter substrate-binding protein [Anaerolineales bacterium]|nr:spermidine/putrescine ABC transporter substrate-binding protein [Anaerolineales bacterium]
MKRYLYALLACTLLLTACASPIGLTDDDEAEPTSPAGPGASSGGEASARCGDTAQLADELQLYTWVEYIDPAIKDQFEEECGVRVVETNFDSNETLLASLQSGATGYDIVVPSDYMVQILISENMLQPLDFGVITNIKHMGAQHVNQYFDPEQQYTVPYFWGTSGLVVDTNVIPDPRPSWKLVFEPSAEACGKISMLDDQRETLGAALMYLGYSLNDTDPVHLGEAKSLLIEQANCVKAYDSQTNDDLAVSGETVIGHIWTGDAILAGTPDAGGREELVYVIPEEGCVIWQDNLAVPVGAPNKHTAEVFINYLNDPQIAAQNANFVGYGTPNQAAKEFVDPELLENPGIYPPKETMARLQWIEDVGDALELYDRVWTEFKAAIGG